MKNQPRHIGTIIPPERASPGGIPFVLRLRKILPIKNRRPETSLILPVERQINSWRKANRKMGWGIKENEFAEVHEPPEIMESDRESGWAGTALFYGFGDDGAGNSDPVLSGKLAWEYTRSKWWMDTWQCEYIDFNRSADIRLRPGAPIRPKGFYFAKFRPGNMFISYTVSRFRKGLGKDTGCGPEGIQLVTITHRYFQNLMNDRKIPFIALADYDVAPYGYNDFFDAVQIFCSNHVLGLGIGNVDQNYPLFGIPSLILMKKGGG